MLHRRDQQTDPGKLHRGSGHPEGLGEPGTHGRQIGQHLYTDVKMIRGLYNCPNHFYKKACSLRRVVVKLAAAKGLKDNTVYKKQTTLLYCENNKLVLKILYMLK